MSVVEMRARMNRRRQMALVTGVLLASIIGGAGCAGPTTSPSAVNSVTADRSGRTGSYVLTATDTGANYAPTFTGNGELGIRVPPAGQGYAADNVPTSSELAGFYAQPVGGVQQRANLPVWSTLTYSDGGQPFTMT